MLKFLQREKVPCYVLVFDQIEIIKKSLDYLCKQADKLEIIVIENPSSNTEAISQLIKTYGESKLIKSYYLFDKNITGMAYDIVINREISKIARSPYVIVTDGDLLSDDDWFSEETGILARNPDVFACGITLDKSNLPLQAFPEASQWIPADIDEHQDYFEACTGGHLLMFRGQGLAGFMRWKNQNNQLFLDSHMHEYCYQQLTMKWARTKRSQARHLTWDLYQDKNHPYTRAKTTKTFDEIWRHRNSANYQLTEY